MKNCRFMLCAMLLIVCVSAKSQYYNPYMYNPYGYYNPYLNQQMTQDAAELGKQMFQKNLEEIQRREKADPTSCIARIGQYIAEKKLSEAKEWCYNLKKVDKKSGYYYLGLVYELQGYPNLAKEQYVNGTNIGDKNCRENLDRLYLEGKMTERQKKNVYAYFNQLKTMYMSNMANQLMDNIQTSSHDHSHSDSYEIDRWKKKRANCTSCGGTGIDRRYSYEGYTPSLRMMGYYNNSGNKCPYCGYYTAHGHDKCVDCLYVP